RAAAAAHHRQQAQPPRPSRRRKRRLSREQRRHAARKAGLSRRQLKRLGGPLPGPVHAVFEPLETVLTRPTHRRLVLLALAAILTVGTRILAKLLRTLGALAPGHPSSYHRVLSHRRWSTRRLARRYIAAVLDRFAPHGTVELVGDDTITEHPGDKVYGQGCHRDPVRSTHAFTASRWGHQWVVLTVLVRFPFCRRRWALPLLVALYRPEEEGVDGVTQRAHKTPVDLLGQMLGILIRWFPDRSGYRKGRGDASIGGNGETVEVSQPRLSEVIPMSSRAYRATRVNDVNWEQIARGKEGLGVILGVDVGKFDVLVVCRWADGRFERPWRIKNPWEIATLVALVRQVKADRRLVVAMESSGTYGDALRQALGDNGIEVERVNGKAAHDYAEVFDGVPSQHDGKDAAVVAELAALGKAK